MFREALEINEKLGRLEGMAIQYGNLGLVHETRGELDEAGRMLRKSLEISEKVGFAEGIVKAHFNLACVFAQKKDANAAVAALAKAIERDPKYRDLAKTHTGYDPIRDDPAFRKLVYGE